jgi:hypothetical protein
MLIFLYRSCKGDAVVHKLNTDRQIVVLDDQGRTFTGDLFQSLMALSSASEVIPRGILDR